LDSNKGSVIQYYSVEQLKKTAALMRGYILTGLCCAGSGHTGGTLSMMDITAALYLHAAKHDPRNPSWADRDRIFWSAGHKAPALYVGLAFAGFFDKLDLGLLRRLRSPLQGHPHWLKLPGVECSSGSLGQGLSVAIGSALAGRLDGRASASWAMASSRRGKSGKLPWRRLTISSTTSWLSWTTTIYRLTARPQP
jgi:transketolase